MSPEQIEVIKKRVKELNTDLDKVTDPKKAGGTAEVEKKVTELLEKTDRWDHVVHTIPTLVERLRTLKQLHQEAASFADTVTQISSEQGVITDSLASQDKLLKTVEANFAKNTAAIQANVESLDRRIAALTEKVEKMK